MVWIESQPIHKSVLECTVTWPMAGYQAAGDSIARPKTVVEVEE